MLVVNLEWRSAWSAVINLEDIASTAGSDSVSASRVHWGCICFLLHRGQPQMTPVIWLPSYHHTSSAVIDRHTAVRPSISFASADGQISASFVQFLQVSVIISGVILYYLSVIFFRLYAIKSRGNSSIFTWLRNLKCIQRVLAWLILVKYLISNITRW